MYKEILSDLKGIDFIETDLKNITPWMHDILLKDEKIKRELINFLERKQIQTRIFYPPIHKLEPYLQNDKQFKKSTNVSERGLWLPSSVSLEDKQVEYICSNIRKFFN